MSDYGISISKEGIDVLTANGKDLQFTSTLDQVKLFYSGELRLELPEEDLVWSSGPQTTSTHTVAYTHSLGYIPMFTPRSNSEIYRNSAGDPDPSGTDDYYINGSVTEMPRYPSGFTQPFAEYIQVYVTSTQLVIEVKRVFGGFAPGTYTFGAHDVYANIVIFINRVDEQVSF